jgi:hypothetical protein
MTKKTELMPTFVEFDEAEDDVSSAFDLPLFTQTPKIRKSMEEAMRKAEAVEIKYPI